MQRLLIRQEPYAPLPTTRRSYVPVLQDQAGERHALAEASSAAWEQMTPLVEVVLTKPLVKHGAIKAHVKRLAHAVGEHPIYLDIKKVAADAPVATRAGERPVLELLYEAARRREMHFMPVAWVDANDAHLAMVAGAFYEEGRGIALRYRPGRAVAESGKKLQRRVARILEDLGADTTDVDLIVDLEYLEPDSEPSTRWLVGFIQRLRKLGVWRSTVLIATSVPSSLGGGLVPENDTRELPLREWALWGSVAESLDVPLAYGDYAVQNPVPPPKPPPVGPWGNIRYTLEGKLVVARGVDINVEPDQYERLSRWIVQHGDFRGPRFSYGDAEILRWSSPATRPPPLFGDYDEDDEEDDEPAVPTTPGYWRGVGTSHHLEQITGQLRGRP